MSNSLEIILGITLEKKTIDICNAVYTCLLISFPICNLVDILSLQTGERAAAPPSVHCPFVTTVARMVVFNAVVSLTRDKPEASLKTIITTEIMFG